MSSVEDVLAQLKMVIAEVDQAAVAVMRVKQHTTDVHAAFAEAGTGTQNADMRRAVTDAKTAGADLRKLAKLLTEAIQDLADYGDTIAPGSGLGDTSDQDGLPSGERIVSETEEQSKIRWLRRTPAKFGRCCRRRGRRWKGGRRWNQIYPQVGAFKDRVVAWWCRRRNQSPASSIAVAGACS